MERNEWPWDEQGWTTCEKRGAAPWCQEGLHAELIRSDQVYQNTFDGRQTQCSISVRGSCLLVTPSSSPGSFNAGVEAKGGLSG